MRHEDCFISELRRVSSSDEYLRRRLGDIAGRLKARVGADACSILLLDTESHTLTVWSSLGGHTAEPFGARIPRGQGVFWKVINHGSPVSFSDLKSDPDYFPHSDLGGDRFASMLCAPLLDGDGCAGAVCVQSEARRDFSPEDIRVLEDAAVNLGCSIKAAMFFGEMARKTRVLAGLNELNGKVGAADGQEEILNHVLKSVLSLTGAARGRIWLGGSNGTPFFARYPDFGGDAQLLRPVEEGIVAAAAASGEQVRVDDVSASSFAGLGAVAKKSLLLQPMVFNGETLGVILAADRAAVAEGIYATFSSDEAGALASVARTAAQAIARVRTTRRLEKALDENRKNVAELSLLSQLSLAMQQVMSLDDMLRVILSCVTVGRGLGFNRAMLFMVNENTGLLQGMMGLGPDSPEEAGRIWRSVEAHSETSSDLVKWLVERDPYEISDSSFNRFARSIRIPARGDSVLARAVREKRAVNVTGPEQLGEGDRDLVAGLRCGGFAVVPLVISDAAMGAILVDNLYNGRPITDAGIELLIRFAAPAAWSIENIKLVERLAAVNRELIALESQMARVEKLSALGEISAEVAHELKNPLVTIGGFARRLLAKIPGSRPEAKYASIIVKEVERLESLLRNTLDVTKERIVEREAADLNQIVGEAVDFYWRAMTEKGIRVNMSLSAEIEKVMIDPAQFKQVVINLLLNAIEAMSCPRHDIEREISVRTEPAGGEAGGARLVISDTGGGVAERDLPEIFNTFFTTKPSGTGLGLSLCKKIVRMSHGTMEIDNRLGVGVTFTITLPYEAISGGFE